MSQLSVTMTADEADLFAKLTQLIAKTAESEAAFKKAEQASTATAAATKAAAEQTEAVARATAQAAKEQDAFAAAGKRLADQLMKSNETLEESYERQQNQLKAAFDSGRLGAADYEKALGNLKSRHDEMKTAQERAALEATEGYRMVKREAEAGVSTVDRLRVANTSLEDKYKQLAVEVTRAHEAGKITADEHATAIQQLDKEYEEQRRSQEETMGEAFTSKTANMVAGWLSIAAVVKAVTDAIAHQNTEIQKGIDLAKKQEDPFKNLTTISADRLELTERIMQAESLQTQEGMDAAKAANLVFALDSAGIISKENTVRQNDQAVDFFGKMNRFADPEAMVNVASQLGASFGMEVPEAVNLTLKAAETSKMNPKEIATMIAMASAGSGQFSQANQRDVAIETAAIVSGLTVNQGNRAGDLAKSAMLKLAQQYPDATPFEAAARANMLSPEDRESTFGNDQSLTIFLSEMERFGDRYSGLIEQSRAAADATGTEDAEFDKKLALSRENIYSEQLRLSANAKAKDEITAKRTKSMVGLQNQATATMAREQVARGQGPLPLLPDFAQNWGISAMETAANLIGFPLQGADRIESDRERESVLRSQVYDAARGADPGISVSGLPGATADEERRHNQMLDELRSLNQKATPPPLVTRPGDDR
jgi:hypothetical protein